MFVAAYGAQQSALGVMQESRVMREKQSLFILLLAAAMAISACRPSTAASQQIQKATVTRGSLQATVSGAGTILARAQVTVQFQNSGQVKTVNVKVGDRVRAGQVMAALDTTDLEAAVISAQAAVDIAQARLAALKKGPLPSQIQAAEASLASAQAAYRAALAKAEHLADQLQIEQENLNNAATRLNDAQNAYNNLLENPRNWRLWPAAPWSSQKAALDNALIDYQVAVANYNLAAANVNDTAVRSAEAQLASAQANLESLKNTPTPEEVQLAELSLKQAQLALEQAKLNLTKAQLIAPFDGIVADVNLQPGQQTGSTVNIVLVDLSQLQARINVSETDLPSIKVGQPAQVTFDALPGQSFTGRVAQVAYVGTATQGVVNYPVTVVLDQTDRAILPGMTASVSIVVQQRDNVLLVPNRAVKLVNRQKVVTVLRDGKPEQVVVTLGMSNDTQSEVVSGLNEGDVVLIQQTTATGQGVPGMGGFGMGGGVFIPR